MFSTCFSPVCVEASNFTRTCCHMHPHMEDCPDIILYAQLLTRSSPKNQILTCKLYFHTPPISGKDWGVQEMGQWD